MPKKIGIVLGTIGVFVVASMASHITSGVGGGGGGGGTGAGAAITGTTATILATTCDMTNDGQIGAPTDGYYDYYVCDGSSWIPFLQGVQVNPPQAGSFTVITSGTGTSVDNTYGAMRLVTTNNSTENLIVIAAPATPYTVKFRLKVQVARASTATQFGAAWRESGAGKCVYWRSYFLSQLNWEWAYSIANANNCTPSTIAGNYTSLANYGNNVNMDDFTLALSDDGTNRTVSDGSIQQVFAFSSNASATNLAAPPDQVGVFISAGTSGGGSKLVVLDYKVE